jgi:peptide/nickel transport system substrate-binding protein
LQWHDGSAVTAEDCVASLARWSKRDGMGQQLFKDVVDLSAADDKTFVMTLRQPYGQVLESLGKPSANVPFMMPKRIAQTDPMQPIEDATGSGPFIFKRDEWQDSKAVYIRNPDYKPRPEPQSLAAGGKVVKVERLEWIYFPDQAEAVRSLLSGKIDYMESPSTKLIPMLEGNPQVVVASADPIGNLAMGRFNHLQPPFDKADVRRAVLLAMRQEDYMTAALGDPRYWKTCYSVFPCGTTFANQAGSEVMATGNVEAAKKALQAAGYDGTPVVLLNPVDAPVMSALTQITAALLQKIGMKVQVENLDWASLRERRNNRGPVSEGGWSMFHTWWNAADVADPTSIAFSGDPENGWYGWVNDEQLASIDSGGAEIPPERIARPREDRGLSRGTPQARRSSQCRPQPPGNRQRHPGDITRFVIAEKQCGIGDVEGLAHALHEIFLLELAGDIFAHVADGRGADDAGRDAVDVDVGRQLLSETAGQRGDARLGGAIVGVAGGAGVFHRGDVDDLAPTAFEHSRRELAHQIEDAFQVDAKTAVPALFGDFQHRRVLGVDEETADHVDEHVDAIEMLAGRRQQLVHLRFNQNAGAVRVHLGAGRQQRRDFLHRGFQAAAGDVGDDEGRALFHEALGEAQSHGAGGAGDKGYFVGKSHRVSRCCRW